MKKVWMISTACAFALAMTGVAAAQGVNSTQGTAQGPTAGGTSKQMEKSETQSTAQRRPAANPMGAGSGMAQGQVGQTQGQASGPTAGGTSKSMEKSETQSTAERRPGANPMGAGTVGQGNPPRTANPADHRDPMQKSETNSTAPK